MYTYILIILQNIFDMKMSINMTFKLLFLELIFQVSDLKLPKYSVPLNILLNKDQLLIM